MLVREELSVFSPCVSHGFEFDDVEGFAVAPDAFLQEYGWTSLQKDAEGDQEQDGEYDDEEDGGEAEVNGAFAPAPVRLPGVGAALPHVGFKLAPQGCEEMFEHVCRSGSWKY